MGAEPQPKRLIAGSVRQEEKAALGILDPSATYEEKCARAGNMGRGPDGPAYAVGGEVNEHIPRWWVREAWMGP